MINSQRKGASAEREVAQANNIPTVACSVEKVIENLVSRGMGLHEAREYTEFNIEGLSWGNIRH